MAMGTADLEKLLGYKTDYANATTDAGRTAASKAADLLRSSAGISQTIDRSDSTSSGNMTAAQISAMLAQPKGATGTTTTSSRRSVPTVTTHKPTYRSVAETNEKVEAVVDRTDYNDIYGSAVDAAYKLMYGQQSQAEQGFQRSLGANQDTLLNSLANTTTAAISSGASAGMQGAQAITALLGSSQQAVEGSIGMAEQRVNIGREEAAAQAEAQRLALTDSNMMKQALAQLNSDLYGYDSASYAAELDANSNDYASDSAFNAQQYASDKALEGAAQTAAATVASARAYSAQNGGSEPAAGYAALFPLWNEYDNKTQSAVAAAYISGTDEAWEYANNLMKVYTTGSANGATDADWLNGMPNTPGSTYTAPAPDANSTVENVKEWIVGLADNPMIAANNKIWSSLNEKSAEAGTALAKLLTSGYGPSTLVIKAALDLVPAASREQISKDFLAMKPSMTQEAKDGLIKNWNSFKDWAANNLIRE